MESLIGCFKNITYIMLAYNFLQNAMWNDKKHKYIKFVAGILIVMAISSPLLKLMTEFEISSLYDELDFKENIFSKDDYIENIFKKNEKMADEQIQEYFSTHFGDMINETQSKENEYTTNQDHTDSTNGMYDGGQEQNIIEIEEIIVGNKK